MIAKKEDPIKINKEIKRMRGEKIRKGALGRTASAISGFAGLVGSTAYHAAIFGIWDLPKTAIQGTRFGIGSLVNKKELPKI